MNLKENDKVLAKPPGSKSFTAGIVTSVGSKECSVEFRNGTEYVIPVKNIIPASKQTPSKSPSRNKSPARRKSPARQKSPARTKSPARPKSPARRTKSPARIKSPQLIVTRKKTSPERIPEVIVQNKLPASPKSPNRSRINQKIIDSDSETERITRRRMRPDSVQNPRTARVSPLTTAIASVTNGIERTTTMARRALRSTISRDREPIILHYKQDDLPVVEDISDNDDDMTYERLIPKKSEEKAQTPKPKAPSESINRPKIEKEFGGTIGVLFWAFVVTFTPLYFNLWCTKAHCSYSEQPRFDYIWKNRYMFFDLKTVIFYFIYIVFHSLIFVLPLGGRIVEGPLTKNGKMLYRCNGMFGCFILIIFAVILEYFNISIFHFINEKRIQLLIVSTLFGMLTAIFLYVRSFSVPISSLNVHANENNFIYDAFMGREITPRLFGYFDVKQILSRCSFDLIILYNISYIIQSFGIEQFDFKSILENNVTVSDITINPTLLLACISQTIYIFDCFLFEAAWITTFEISQEGLGYMFAVGYSIFPWITTPLGKYILENNIQYPWWIITIAAIIFSFAYTVFRASNLQKDAFRKNPFSPSTAHLESIPTPQGKKLLVSGYWGVVRKPNYISDIVMSMIWSGLVYNAPPALLFFPFCFPFLLYRAQRDGARCKRRYGSAWERYCERVPYVFVPKVF